MDSNKNVSSGDSIVKQYNMTSQCKVLFPSLAFENLSILKIFWLFDIILHLSSHSCIQENLQIPPLSYFCYQKILRLEAFVLPLHSQLPHLQE